MTFSQSFLDRYKDNAEMQEVIQNADARLVGASISDADKETIYESLYGFKHAIADKYGFDMDPIYDKLEKLGYTDFLLSEVTNIPNNYVSMDDETKEKVLSLVESLEDIDDVQSVYHNMEM